MGEEYYPHKSWASTWAFKPTLVRWPPIFSGNDLCHPPPLLRVGIGPDSFKKYREKAHIKNFPRRKIREEEQ